MANSNPLNEESHEKDSAAYEDLRISYQNGYVPAREPAEIVTPFVTPGVVTAMNRAHEHKMHIGGRSGGHQWAASGLLQDGILFDMRHVNREVVYDADTETVSFGPAVTAAEILAKMLLMGWFFPHGHTPAVGLGGFLLAGGQGWFFRGRGLTAESWILQIEVVTAAGETVIASPETNSDLFWAARGSGQGFFGVVTKFWGRTISVRKLFPTRLLFNAYEGRV